MTIEIKAKDIVLVPIGEIVPNPDNNNRHSIEQIDRLCYMIQKTGFRDPLIVSKNTGFLICGEGRLLAAQKLEMEMVPVSYQDFDGVIDEYEFLTGHNEISNWSELDYHKTKVKMKELPLDIKAMGLKSVEPIKRDILDNAEQEDKPKRKRNCPECGALI